MSNENTLVVDDVAEEAVKTEDTATLVTDADKENEVTTQAQEKDKPEDKEEKPQGAPENYEDFTLPEGMEVDSELLDEARPLFKELNLTQEQAQKLVDLQSKYVREAAEKQLDAWKETVTTWADESKKDKEFGGAKFEESLGYARTAIKQFATDDFKEMLNVSGTGNHKEMIRFLTRVGKAISDDKILHGTKQTEAVRDRAKTMFPDMN